MNGPLPDWKSFSFWGKTVVQGIILYNSLYHRNIDPSVGLGVVAGMESVYHGVQGLVHAAHAVKDAFKPALPAVIEPPKP